jgi:hypothetical protein
VRHTWWNLDHVAGPGTELAQPHAEGHATVDHLEALGLDGVDVRDRHGAARAESEVEGEQLAAGAARGLGEGEALTRHGVLEGLAGGDHRGLLRCLDRLHVCQ